MAKSWKEWERPLIELENDLVKLKKLAEEAPEDKQQELAAFIRDVERRRDRHIEVIYSRLGAWEKVLVARAEPRPYTLDYVRAIFTDFVELQGDRRFGADQAIVGGPALLDGRSCMVIGHQKGRTIQERAQRNFGMAHPEGYRKAIRLMDMADRFCMPVVTFVDTPAADPSPESEARGISEAIAASMQQMFRLGVPAVSVVIGEGGSGGAIALAAANRLYMQEHAIYSVIPPEGCAAILWRSPDKGPEAAAALRLTAQMAEQLGLVDGIVPEPFGGAHRDLQGAAAEVKSAIVGALGELGGLSPDDLRRQRYERFRRIGVYEDATGETASSLA